MLSYNSLNARKKRLVSEMSSFVGSNQAESMIVLDKFDWNLEIAADAYLGGEVDVAALVAASNLEPAAPDTARLDSWFDRYADSNDRDLITSQGIEEFYNELNLDTEAKEMCVYTREEWRRGMMAMGVESIQQLKNKLGELNDVVSDRSSETFREFYSFCFDYANDFPLLEDLPAFLVKNKVPVMSKDMWTQIFAFLCQVKPDLSNFDPLDAWPVVVDEFVDMKLAQNPVGISKGGGEEKLGT